MSICDDNIVFSTLSVLFLCLCYSFLVVAETEDSVFNTNFPKNEYEHFLYRDRLIKEEKEFENRNWNYTKDEETVNNFLGYLKWKELERTKSTGFPPSRPIEKVLKDVQQSELYAALKKLPKGGNLHSHEDHQLSKRLLFDIIWKSRDFYNLYIVNPNSTDQDAWMMDFFINPPPDKPWIKVKNCGFTKENILQKNTLIGLLTTEATNNPTDSATRWTLINPLWARASVQLISNVLIKRSYLRAVYTQSMSEGISYLETRRSLGWEMPLYQLDRTGKSEKTFGKMFLDSDYDLEVTLAMNQTKELTKDFRYFIGHKRISYAVRFMDHKQFQTVMNTTLRLHRKYPQHVIGFDAVGQEDSGYASLNYLKDYLSLYENGKSAMPLYLHSVETSWPEDILTGGFYGDLVPTLQNAYESVILLAKRIGHGKGLVKKPYLKEILKKRKTAVEVCVVSNQLLGMDPDIRNHYGQTLYKEGIPIVLAPDDPGTFGYDNVTVDWYMVFLGWGLNLGDLKQLALNSLLYSGMEESEKQNAINNKWMPNWKDYIAAMKTKALAHLSATENKVVPAFHHIMPASGIPGTNVHIFGRNFESAIFGLPQCMFGSVKVQAVFKSVQELECVAPKVGDETVKKLVTVQITFDGQLFQDTGFTFEYN